MLDTMKNGEKLAYCAHCDDFVQYEMRKRTSKCQIRGVDIECEEHAAFCLNCGKPVWVDGIDSYNVRSTRIAYCEKVGLITPDEIENLQQKYGIGTRALSELLGWDESILTRYLNGTIPSEKCSKILKKLLESDDAFYRLVDSNKDWMKPEAYRALTKNRKPAITEDTYSQSRSVIAGTYTYNVSDKNDV